LTTRMRILLLVLQAAAIVVSVWLGSLIWTSVS
jgi:hypothetical protein